MENKHILILSANTGGGHNSAARAIAAAMKRQGRDCTIADGLGFLPPMLNRLICGGHIFLYRRLPKLFGLIYDLSERIDFRPGPVRPIRKRRSGRHLGRLLQYIQDGYFDAVICTHVFAAQMVSALRRTGLLKIPCCFLATDYSCSPGVHRLDMDRWLLPHRALIPEFVSRGVPEGKISVTGIPVDAAFSRNADRFALRRALHLTETGPIAVLSCGSMGAGSMAHAARTLAKAMPEDGLLVALCASNRRVLHQLQSAPCEHLLALGYVESMADYMAAADVYLGKPGGLSSTEVMSLPRPLLLINAVPGVETRNRAFLTRLGCAATSKDLIGMQALLHRAFSEPDFAASLSESCAAEFDGHAADRICKLLWEII